MGRIVHKLVKIPPTEVGGIFRSPLPLDQQKLKVYYGKVTTSCITSSQRYCSHGA
jgi:hypothetical protein